MNTNYVSPLVPQGTLPDSRGKSRVQFTVLTILAVHAVVLGVVLLQGCKRTATDPNLELQALATNNPPPDAFAPPPVSTPPIEVAQPQTPIHVPPSATQLDTQPPPALTTPPEPFPTGGASQHVVVQGDTFSSIAKRYGVTVRAVAEANPGVESTRLKLGQKLNVPPPTRTAAGATGSATNGSEKTYVVKSGDTLSRIARIYGTTPRALRSANRLRTDQIKVGQTLTIPAKGSLPAVESGVGASGSHATPLP